MKCFKCYFDLALVLGLIGLAWVFYKQQDQLVEYRRLLDVVAGKVVRFQESNNKRLDFQLEQIQHLGVKFQERDSGLRDPG